MEAIKQTVREPIKRTSLGLSTALIEVETDKLTPLHEYAGDKDSGIGSALRYFKRPNAEKDIDNNSNVNLQTPLHISSKSGVLDMTKLLVEKGANLESKDKIGRL